MIYVLYDTALNGLYTLRLLQESYPNHCSIFKDTKDEILSDVAPYIFSVDKDLFEKIKDPFASLQAITVVESDKKLQDLLDHFQQFIYKKIKEKEIFFRFWDARVLSRFLPAATVSELNSFFDGIRKFYVLDTEIGNAKSFYIKRGKLATEITALHLLYTMANEEQLIAENDSKGTEAPDGTEKTKRTFFN